MAKHTKLGVDQEFFKELREGSRTKQKIVFDYFIAYNRVMANRCDKVGYADLFAGPGNYGNYTKPDGSVQKSIPVMVTEAAVGNELFAQKVHLWFNEGDEGNFEKLTKAIGDVPGVASLKYKPAIQNKILDRTWVSKIKGVKVPTLLFLDPCGYKGLSLRLVQAALEGFGNDCIFFFNYSRINMKLDLEVMNESIDEFFEAGRAAALRAEIQNKSAPEREEIILGSVRKALEDANAIPLIFKFKSENGRTSHHLVYASKDAKAAGMMKRILKGTSSEVVDGVGSWEHDPRSRSSSLPLFGGIFELTDELLRKYRGRTIRFGEVLELEVLTQYTGTNYRDALLELEALGRVTIDPPANERAFQAGRTKKTLPENALIKFRD